MSTSWGGRGGLGQKHVVEVWVQQGHIAHLHHKSRGDCYTAKIINSNATSPMKQHKAKDNFVTRSSVNPSTAGHLPSMLWINLIHSSSKTGAVRRLLARVGIQTTPTPIG